MDVEFHACQLQNKLCCLRIASRPLDTLALSHSACDKARQMTMTDGGSSRCPNVHSLLLPATNKAFMLHMHRA